MDDNIKVQKHKEICAGLSELYRQKNKDYGDSYAKGRKKRPDTILTRFDDKIERLDTLYKNGGQAEVLSESIEDTLRDIANYAIMELIERGIDNEQASGTTELELTKKKLAEVMEELNKYKNACSDDQTLSADVRKSTSGVQF